MSIASMLIMRSVREQEDNIKIHYATEDIRRELKVARARIVELEKEVQKLRESKEPKEPKKTVTKKRARR